MEKTFLSIGAGPGIGLSTAIRFAKEGYRPILASRTPEKLNNLAHTIQKATGLEAETYPLDAGDMQQMAEFGSRFSPTVVHFNAAIVHAETLAEATLQSMELDIRVGITAAMAAIKVFAPAMLQRKEGTILLTGGGFAYSPSADYLTLGVAKAGIHNMAHALFPVFAEQNVHIACLNITRAIAPASPEAEEVAEAFWRLHSQTRAQWVCEAKDVGE